MCFVPMAIDQDPYFRMARDIADKLKCPKPAVIHSEFLPGLKQTQGKMSTTDESSKMSTIFLNMKPEEVSNAIKKNAFTGGCQSLEEHKKYGGDIKIDIPYQYLTYFMESDEELKEIAKKYTSGEMSSGEIKEITAQVVSKVIAIIKKHLVK